MGTCLHQMIWLRRSGLYRTVYTYYISPIFQTESRLGNLLRFAISDGGLNFVDGELEKADLHYLGKSNRACAFADSYSKVMFQYMTQHSPLRIDDLLASITH